MDTVSISVIIPTKNRKKDLIECIKSIIGQTLSVEEVIVIDDGNLSKNKKAFIQSLLEKSGIKFNYFKKDIPGLAESKNIGAREASNETILYVDDDVILQDQYISFLKSEWDKNKDNPKLGGIGGVIENLRKASFLEKVFNRFFFLSSRIGWDVTEVGFQVWDPSLRKTEKAFYLSGGISSFRRDLVLKIPFRSLSPGRTALEDVDFFMRAKKEGNHFLIVPGAKAFHKESIVSRDTDFIIGKKEGFNRLLIFKGNVSKNFKNGLQFLWASTGWTLRQFLGGNFRKGWGMIIGYFHYFRLKPNKKGN